MVFVFQNSGQTIVSVMPHRAGHTLFCAVVLFVRIVKVYVFFVNMAIAWLGTFGSETQALLTDRATYSQGAGPLDGCFTKVLLNLRRRTHAN